MLFGRTKETQPTQRNERERQQSTNRVLSQASEILDIPEVKDSLEALNIKQLPNLLQRVYVASVEGDTIDANKSNGYVPLVSLFPRETLHFKELKDRLPNIENSISLDLGDLSTSGVMYQKPRPIIALSHDQNHHPSAPLTLIHELTHVRQLSNPVNQEFYKEYPNFGGPKEAEALCVEAMIAHILVNSKRSKWANNPRLFSDFTRHIDKHPPKKFLGR